MFLFESYCRWAVNVDGVELVAVREKCVAFGVNSEEVHEQARGVKVRGESLFFIVSLEFEFLV